MQNLHAHIWEERYNSKPRDEEDTHIIFLECSCGLRIEIFNSNINIVNHEQEMASLHLPLHN